MKKLLLFSIILITFTNVSYSSFPITENSASEVLLSTATAGPEEEIPLIVRIIAGLGVLLGLFFLIRTWWRSYKDRKRWARILPWIVLSIILVTYSIMLMSMGVSGL